MHGVLLSLRTESNPKTHAIQRALLVAGDPPSRRNPVLEKSLSADQWTRLSIFECGRVYTVTAGRNIYNGRHCVSRVLMDNRCYSHSRDEKCSCSLPSRSTKNNSKHEQINYSNDNNRKYILLQFGLLHDFVVVFLLLLLLSSGKKQ